MDMGPIWGKILFLSPLLCSPLGPCKLDGQETDELEKTNKFISMCIPLTHASIQR